MAQQWIHLTSLMLTLIFQPSSYRKGVAREWVINGIICNCSALLFCDVSFIFKFRCARSDKFVAGFENEVLLSHKEDDVGILVGC